MAEKCGKSDSHEYIEAQALANDYVFKYMDKLPPLNYASGEEIHPYVPHRT